MPAIPLVLSKHINITEAVTGMNMRNNRIRLAAPLTFYKLSIINLVSQIAQKS